MMTFVQHEQNKQGVNKQKKSRGGGIFRFSEAMLLTNSKGPKDINHNDVRRYELRAPD
jgi:hypothetical protein